MKSNFDNRLRQVTRRVAFETSPRCIKGRASRDPPALMNAGDVWHSRIVQSTSLAASDGTSTLTSGALMTALSANAANLPIRLRKIAAWAIAGTAGTYPPTFIQVDFRNEEFTQQPSGAGSVRDSIADASGPGHIAGVCLRVPQSLQLIRNDWALSTATVLATATGLPSGARVCWQISLEFKF